MEKCFYIISGPNGAGKTTAAKTFLPEIWHCNRFVNADEIAHELCPEDPLSKSIEAGRQMLMKIDDLFREDVQFAIETTLSTRSYYHLVRRAQSLGYFVVVIYFWLPSPMVAQQRVAMRVREGGHNIPDDVVIRRYYRGLKNFFTRFTPIADFWMLVDNSVIPSSTVAQGGRNYKEIKNELLYSKIYNQCQNRT